jgi:hypothetical protein
MASTIVRVYRLEPADIQIRRATYQEDGEFIVTLGDIVAVQGNVGQLRSLFSLAVHRLDSEAALKARGEPF